jgi:hypothetical protein
MPPKGSIVAFNDLLSALFLNRSRLFEKVVRLLSIPNNKKGYFH